MKINTHIAGDLYLNSLLQMPPQRVGLGLDPGKATTYTYSMFHD